MTNFIIEAIIWTLALYGFMELIKNIYFLLVHTKLKSDGIYMIIAVKNQEDKIEGFLRSILFRLIYGKENFIKDIIVTDLDSMDQTKEILEKLNKDYDCLKITKWKDCKELIDNIEKANIAH